jgi:hypothetical protein
MDVDECLGLLASVDNGFNPGMSGSLEFIAIEFN